MNLKKNGNVFMSKFVGTGPSSYEKRIYRAAVSQRLRNTDLGNMGTDLTMANTQPHFDACLFNIIISLNFLLHEQMEILYIAITVDGSEIVYLYKTIFVA